MRETQINKKVLNLADDHTFSAKKVLSWIDTQQEIAKQARSAARRLTGAKSLQSKGKATRAEGYIKEMRRYLRTGLWVNGTNTKICYGEYENQWSEGGYFEAP
tara:strand:+ start:357 stop:665 length:309 start_codon:yes stop_codon:yes gene_type:complete